MRETEKNTVYNYIAGERKQKIILRRSSDAIQLTGSLHIQSFPSYQSNEWHLQSPGSYMYILTLQPWLQA